MHVQPLGRVDPLEEEMATLSSIPAWRIPMDRGDWRAPVHGVAKKQTRLSGHAVVSNFETIVAKPLPPGTSAQLAELIVLT